MNGGGVPKGKIGLFCALLRAWAKRRDARARHQFARRVCIQLETLLNEKRAEEFTAHGERLDAEARVDALRTEFGWTWPEDELHT